MKEDWPQVGNCLSSAMGTWSLLFSPLYLEVLEISIMKRYKKRFGLEENKISLFIKFSIVSN